MSSHDILLSLSETLRPVAISSETLSHAATFIFGGASENVVNWLAYAMFITAFSTFLSLVFVVSAPYGRYFQEGKAYGKLINGKIAWFIQEFPAFLIPVVGLAYHYSELPLANKIILALFITHYIHRVFVFSFKLKGKPTPFGIMLMAFAFCVYNGTMISSYLINVTKYDDSWLYDPRFIFGIILFFTGMTINIKSDYHLLSLRKPGETSYKIPTGFMFEYVSGANFFGEIVEWFGFAIASWSIVGFAFAIFTFSNIAPRGAAHHRWYHAKFEDYPKSRKAVIPFVW